MNIREISRKNASKFVSCITFIIPKMCSYIKKTFTIHKIYPVEYNEPVCHKYPN